MAGQKGFAETNRVANGIIEEVEWGKTPVSTPVTGTISAVAASSTFESDTATSGPPLTDIQAGDTIEVTGYTDATNNGFFRATAVDTSTTTHTVTVDATLVDEAGDGDEVITPPIEVLEAAYTSEDGGQTITTTASNRVRADAQVPLNILTGVEGINGYSGELVYDDAPFEKLLRGVIRAPADFDTPPASVTGEIAAVAANNQFTANSANGVDFSTIGPGGSALMPGDWIRTANFSNDANNGFFQITQVDLTVTPKTITVVGKALVDETAAAGRTIQGSAYIRNGTSVCSFSQVKQFQDVGGGTEVRITGFKPSQTALTFNPQSIMTYQISGQGEQAEDSDRNALVSPDVTAFNYSRLSRLVDATLNASMTTVDGVGELIVRRDDPIEGLSLNSLSLTPQQSLRNQNAINSPGFGPSGIGQGRLTLNGSLTAFFEAGALPLLQFQRFDLAIVTRDRPGNAYLWDFPSVNISGDNISKGTGVDQDTQINVTVEGQLSDRLGVSNTYTVGVHKFVALT